MMENEEVQIVIPMTGYGSRFVSAGYRDLKPMIRIFGTPIIKWIVDGIFPGEENITFVCRREHIDTVEGMAELLKSISPSGNIYTIDHWEKKGPVFDVLRAEAAIDDKLPVIINYCDFYMSWDWPQMKKRMLERGCDGCVPCYTGFHPHLLPRGNVYASCFTDDNGNLVEIREKFSFEKDKTRAKHSPGTYYFKTGSLLKKYCQELVDSNQTINGEYYASMPYNFMVRDKLKVWVPTDIKYFCQWGTPEDMEESIYWMNLMRTIAE